MFKTQQVMRRIGVSLTVAIVACGCSQELSPVLPDQSILPLQVGNHWIGEGTSFRADGSIRSQGRDTIRIVRDTIVSGERRFVTSANEGYVRRADGIYLWNVGALPTPISYFKFPASTGDRVVVPFVYLGSDTLIVTVVSTDAVVTVPAGTFATYHYLIQSTLTNTDIHQYLAPDVGFVRIEKLDRSPDSLNRGSSVWLLIESRLSPEP